MKQVNLTSEFYQIKNTIIDLSKVTHVDAMIDEEGKGGTLDFWFFNNMLMWFFVGCGPGRSFGDDILHPGPSGDLTFEEYEEVMTFLKKTRHVKKII